MEQKQREKQTPNNNDNYQPPINNSPPIDNYPKDSQENFPHPQNNSNESANSQIDGEEREREREQTTHGGNLPPPSNQNNLQPEAKKADHTPIYLVSGVVGIIIVAVGISLVIAAKRKRKNGRRYQK